MYSKPNVFLFDHKYRVQSDSTHLYQYKIINKPINVYITLKHQFPTSDILQFHNYTLPISQVYTKNTAIILPPCFTQLIEKCLSFFRLVYVYLLQINYVKGLCQSCLSKFFLYLKKKKKSGSIDPDVIL